MSNSLHREVQKLQNIFQNRHSVHNCSQVALKQIVISELHEPPEKVTCTRAGTVTYNWADEKLGSLSYPRFPYHIKRH